MVPDATVCELPIFCQPVRKYSLKLFALSRYTKISLCNPLFHADQILYSLTGGTTACMTFGRDMPGTGCTEWNSGHAACYGAFTPRAIGLGRNDDCQLFNGNDCTGSSKWNVRGQSPGCYTVGDVVRSYRCVCGIVLSFAMHTNDDQKANADGCRNRDEYSKCLAVCQTGCSFPGAVLGCAGACSRSIILENRTYLTADSQFVPRGMGQCRMLTGSKVKDCQRGDKSLGARRKSSCLPSQYDIKEKLCRYLSSADVAVLSCSLFFCSSAGFCVPNANESRLR